MSTSQHLRGLTFTNLLSSSSKGFRRLTFSRKTTLHVSASEACFLNLWAALRDAHCTQTSRAELWSIMGALVINRADCLIHQTRYICTDMAVSLLGGRADFKAIFAIWHYMSSSPVLLSVCFHELPSTTLSFSGEAAYCWVCTKQEFLRNMWRTRLKAIRFQHSRNLW